jgi:hypothetical protein
VKRIWGIALVLLASCPLPLAAAKNSCAFFLPDDVRVGDLQIPHGQYEVTWTEPAGSQVELRLKADGEKPITIPARLVAEKHSEAGVTTFVDSGVTYLQDFHTTKEAFIIPGTPSVSK